MRIHTKQGRKLAAGAVCMAVGAVLLLWYPEAAAGGVSRGLSLCGQVLIPSLFPFLVLGAFLIRSGIAAAVGRRLEKGTRFLFGLPGCCAAGMVMAFAGGYPAGAAAVAGLVKQGDITPDEGRRMMRFCVAGGPGFIVNAVGVGMAGSRTLGLILFAASSCAAAMIGIVTAPRSARRGHTPATMVRVQPAAFTGAVRTAVETMVTTCGFVLLFSAITSLLDALGVTAALSNRTLAALPACFLEVTGGCAAAANTGAAAPFLLGFTVCFGGLSIVCQIAAVLGGSGVFSGEFLLFRLIHGVLGGILTVLLLQVVPLPLAVFGGQGAPVGEWVSGNAGISAALLVLCGVWMLTAAPKTVDDSVEI